MKGRIVRLISGFYTVDNEDERVVCRAAGRFRQMNAKPIVGDHVIIDKNPDGSGTIREILPRRNYFVRPSVANIDLIIMIASEAFPVTDPYLIDRITVLAAFHSCDFLLCINKIDIASGDRLFSIYNSADIPVIRTSAKDGTGIHELSERTTGKVCAMVGNSGVGKSSLINALDPSFALRTGDISDKLHRGKHTTRHVELFPLSSGGYIADTPGFGDFDTDQADRILPERLDECFTDFRQFLGRCRYMDCRHVHEPGCSVREAVESGAIQNTRYDSYVRLIADAVDNKAKEYK